jgi:hypothetical protein
MTKSLRKHFAREIQTGAAELNVTMGSFLIATILGLPPPPGTVAITDDEARVRLAMLYAKARMGWREAT